jgi:thioredoxin reductase (NADPH)
LGRIKGAAQRRSRRLRRKRQQKSNLNWEGPDDCVAYDAGSRSRNAHRQRSRSMREFDIVVIGAGVAGLTAAMQAARCGLNVAVIERMGVGGQIAAAERIENFPGIPQSISGAELGPLLHEQAEAAGAEFILDTVEGIAKDGERHIVNAASESIGARAVIVAAGSTLKSLGVPGEKAFLGRGVSHCASCDGHFFSGQEVCVVGGGDSALDEALVLTEYAARVVLINRGEALDAQRVLVDRIATNAKIETVPSTAVEEIFGDDSVAGVRLRDLKSRAVHERAVKGVFVYVGLEPNTAFLRGVVALDGAGHIDTDLIMQTSVPGIFAAGDIRAHSAAQLTSAVGDGATAAIAAWRYLKQRA